MKITVSKAKYLAACNLVQAKDDVRYYLKGVKFEAHPEAGIVLIATDGHRLVVIHDSEGAIEGDYNGLPIETCQHVIVDTGKTAGAAIRKVATLNDPVFIDIADNLETSVTINGQTFSGQGPDRAAVVDGKFPEWRRVVKIPAKRQALAFFDPSYLSDFGQIAKWLSRGDKHICAGTLAQSDKNSPVFCQFSRYPEVCAVLMPMRVDDKDMPSADWLADLISTDRHVKLEQVS